MQQKSASLLQHWELFLGFNLVRLNKKVATAPSFIFSSVTHSRISVLLPESFFQPCNVSEIYNPPALLWGSSVLEEGDAWISVDGDDTDGTSQRKSKPVWLYQKPLLSEQMSLPLFFTGTWRMKSLRSLKDLISWLHNRHKQQASPRQPEYCFLFLWELKRKSFGHPLKISEWFIPSHFASATDWCVLVRSSELPNLPKPPFSWREAAAFWVRPIVSSFPVVFDLNYAEGFHAAAQRAAAGGRLASCSVWICMFNYFGTGTSCKTADVPSFQSPSHPDAAECRAIPICICFHSAFFFSKRSSRDSCSVFWS